MIVATIQILFVGKRFSVDQWKAMFLQANGMIIVQYNPCKSTTRYAPIAYVLMSLSAVITSTTAVRNEYLVKNYPMSLNVQNMLLYAAGAFCNIGAFLFVPNPNSAQANLGFFEGFDNPLALGVVFVNSIIGLAITAVYKYADAVTKCFATDITAVLLCIISTIFFELQPSITMWCGVIVVCYAVHNYTSAAPPPAPTKPTGTSEVDKVQSPSEMRELGSGPPVQRETELGKLLGRKTSDDV